MKKKKKYEQPYILNITVVNELMTTFSSDHTPGHNNGTVGDAKSNTLFFDEDDNEEDNDDLPISKVLLW
jgi:hypothetical protein